MDVKSMNNAKHQNLSQILSWDTKNLISSKWGQAIYDGNLTYILGAATCSVYLTIKLRKN